MVMISIKKLLFNFNNVLPMDWGVCRNGLGWGGKGIMSGLHA